MKFLSKLLLIFGFNICKAEFVINDDYLAKIATIESNGNPNAIGDGGKAIGLYQMHKGAYEDACAYLKITYPDNLEFFQIGNFKKDCLEPEKARVLCFAYLTVLKNRMINGGHKVNKYTLYVAYNKGYNGGRAVNFKMNYPCQSAVDKAKYFRCKQILDL